MSTTPINYEEDSTALIIRKHNMTLLKPATRSFFPIFIGLLLVVLSKGQVMSLIGLLLLFVGLSYFLFSVIIWYHDIVVITKSKVMSINQRSLFKRDIKEVSINKVSNISLKTTGFFSALFGFGSVYLTSSQGELVLADLKNPIKVKNILEKLQQKGSLSANELIEYIIKAKQELA